MKRAPIKLSVLLILTALAAVLVLLSGTAAAQLFHSSDGLICSECHTMHYSEDGTTPTNADSGGPFNRLLLKMSSSDLCLICHDGQVNKPDVVDADVNGLTERAAGQFKSPGTPNANGHNLSTGAYDVKGSSLCNLCHFGGSFPDAEIGCINCHDPHGNGKYRNLHWASDPGAEPEIRARVNPAASGMAVYEQDNIGYTAPSSGTSWREVTNVCIDCHHTFSGYTYTRKGGASNAVCIRHPNADSERGASEPVNKQHQPGTTDPTHWTAGTGNGFSIGRLPFIVRDAPDYATATTVAATNEVFCLTCHKAHGSANPNSLRWDYSGAGDNKGCQQCHNK